MRQFLGLLSLALVAVKAVIAAPRPVENANQVSVLPTDQIYCLRVNAQDGPFNGRHLIALPTSQRLGLENFTVHPATPPLRFVPVLLDNGNYALRGETDDDDPSQTPWLASLNSQLGTRTVSMKIVHLQDPSTETLKATSNACPEGYWCTADQWALNTANDDGVYPNLRYTGFDGKWYPIKDTGNLAEGWHVYWKSESDYEHPVLLDLVPLLEE